MDGSNSWNGSSFFDERTAQIQQAKSERRKIRLLGFYAGAAILLYIFIQNILVALMTLTGFYSQYRADPLLQDSVDILLILTSLLLPFLLLSRPMQTVSDLQDGLQLEFPQKGSHAMLAVPAGIAVCLLANNLTSHLIALLAGFGLQLTSPYIPMPGGLFGIVVSFLRVVAIATITEELCFRGVLMQNLRRFGNGFAVFIAAALFGMVHGNLVQAPFAFTVGLILGWFAVTTGSIWTSILIHGCNNLISLLLSYLSEVLNRRLLGAVDLFLNSFFIMLGLVCLALFLSKKPRMPQLANTGSLNGFWAKTGAFVSNPTMILALIYMIYAMSRFVTTAG